MIGILGGFATIAQQQHATIDDRAVEDVLAEVEPAQRRVAFGESRRRRLLPYWARSQLLEVM